MDKRIRMRVGKVVAALALFGIAVGFPHTAKSQSTPTCYYYIGCEACSCREMACQWGEYHPECNGNWSCCQEKEVNCYRTCYIWY